MMEKKPFRWHDRSQPVPPELQEWFDEEEQKQAIDIYETFFPIIWIVGCGFVLVPFCLWVVCL